MTLVKDKICVRTWKPNGETRVILEYKLPVLLYAWKLNVFQIIFLIIGSENNEFICILKNLRH